MFLIDNINKQNYINDKIDCIGKTLINLNIINIFNNLRTMLFILNKEANRWIYIQPDDNQIYIIILQLSNYILEIIENVNNNSFINRIIYFLKHIMINVNLFIINNNNIETIKISKIMFIDSEIRIIDIINNKYLIIN